MPASSRLDRSKLPAAEIEVARRLREERKRERFSIAELARESGLSKAALQHYEGGTAPLTFAAGDALCKRLDLHQYWLATGEQPRHRWLDLSAFPDDMALVEEARRQSLFAACTGILKPLFAKWRETHPDELLIGETIKAGIDPALRKMSDAGLESFLAETAAALRKSKEDWRRGAYRRMLRVALDCLDARQYQKKPVDSEPHSEVVTAMQIAERIKRVRAKLGLTQTEAAEKWGVPMKTLQRWEYGKHKPRGLGLVQLETILRAAEQPPG